MANNRQGLIVEFSAKGEKFANRYCAVQYICLPTVGRIFVGRDPSSASAEQDVPHNNATSSGAFNATVTENNGNAVNPNRRRFSRTESSNLSMMPMLSVPLMPQCAQGEARMLRRA